MNYQSFNSTIYAKPIELLKKIQEDGVIVFGASGEMGSKISSTFPKASCPVLMQDIDKEKLEESKENALKELEKATQKRKLSKRQWEIINSRGLFRKTIAFPDKGKLPSDETDKAVSDFLDLVLGQKSESRNNYSNAMMVLEAGPEILSFKQNVFRFFELALSSKEAILATNTSSLSIDEIAAKVEHPERVVGFHYFLPADRNPLIEIIAGSKTSIEVIQAMQNLAIAMGKKPIISWKDKPGAIANRILVGLLNEAAKIADEGIASVEVIDRVFLETFYSEQIKIQTKPAKRQFEAAPKLAFFKDEASLYKEIKECEKDPVKKKLLLEEAQGRLRQKVLYAQIVENLSRLGSFFTPAPSVLALKERAQAQLKIISQYLANPSKPFLIEPYDFPKPTGMTPTNHKKRIISERLQGAYIALGQEILKEGLATPQDIELACKEGFKYNTGPLELAQKLGKEKSKELIALANEGLEKSRPTGISKTEEYIELLNSDLSGIQTYIQDDIAFINLGRLHIQNLAMTQNSLGPEMLESILSTIQDLERRNVKTIVFRSQGGGAFSSGADLNYIASTNWDIEKILAFRNLGKKVMDTIANCKIPTVAILDGPAVGGGLELTLACDYRIMTDLSFIAMPEVGLGIIPDWGGTERLPALIGKELAKRLICTAKLKNLGLKLSGEDCFKVQLADLLTTQAELLSLISDLISGKAPIDIYKKPSRKSNFDKSDYPEHIIRRFDLSKPFKHQFRWVTRHAAHFAEDLINHSDDPSYAKRVDDDAAFTKLIQSGKKVSNRYINPMLTIVQNKFLAPIFEKIGLL